MTFIRKGIRIIWLVFLIVLALSGLAIGMAMSPRRERDFDGETKIELVEKDLHERLTNIQGEKRRE